MATSNPVCWSSTFQKIYSFVVFLKQDMERFKRSWQWRFLVGWLHSSNNAAKGWFVIYQSKEWNVFLEWKTNMLFRPKYIFFYGLVINNLLFWNYDWFFLITVEIHLNFLEKVLLYDKFRSSCDMPQIFGIIWDIFFKNPKFSWYLCPGFHPLPLAAKWQFPGGRSSQCWEFGALDFIYLATKWTLSVEMH